MRLNLLLDAHVGEWALCRRCNIGKWAQNHVMYRGKIPAHFLIVGEAPGRDEDKDGEPFVGRSGVVLDRWIKNAVRQYFLVAESPITVPRFAITNTVCCRPTSTAGGPNRAPNAEETANCSSRLDEFVRIAQPRAIVCVGRPAEARCAADGFWDRPHVFLYHPAYFMRPGPKNSSPEMESEKLAHFVKEQMTCPRRYYSRA